MDGGLAATSASKRAALAVAACLGVSYAYFYQGGGWNQNTRFALVRAIVQHGTLRIDDTAKFEGRLVTGDLARHDGHLYSDKAPGAALAAVAPVAVGLLAVPEPDSPIGIAVLSYLATLAVSGLSTVVAALLVLRVAGMFGAAGGAGIFAALVFGLATPAWCYATILYGHALAGACLMAAFAAALQLRRSGDASTDLRLALAVGAAGGWATISEYPSVVPAAILSVLALSHAWADASRRARVAGGIAIGALACVALLAAHNAAAFGSPLRLGYAHEAGDFAGMTQGYMGITYPKPAVIGELLFGRFRGLLYCAPILALAPVGFAMGLRTAEARRGIGAAAVIALYYLLFNASYFYWDGGWCYGPRHMGPALGFVALGLAPLWTRGAPFVRAGLAALALYSAASTLVVVATTAQPPDNFKRPYAELIRPNFERGRLSINQQSFVEDAPVRQREPLVHAWNVGELLGLPGRASLIPLLVTWVIVGLGWWMLRQQIPSQAVASPASDHPARTVAAGSGVASSDASKRRRHRASPPRRRGSSDR